MSNITMTTGSEGPRHDPYAYTELTVTFRDGALIVAHYNGLATWIEDFRGDRWNVDDKQLVEVFELFTGMTLVQAERAVRKLEESYYRRHKAHGGYQWSSGYPGEELCFCKCGQVIDSTFNESAII